MSNQDESSNPSGSQNGQGDSPVVVETVHSDTSRDEQGDTLTDHQQEVDHEENHDAKEGTNLEERSQVHSEKPGPTGQVPEEPASTFRDEQDHIGQGFPGLWETLDVQEVSKGSTKKNIQDNAPHRGEVQTIEFDDTEPFERTARRSSTTIQQMIDHARRQSATTFQSPPSISRVNRSSGNIGLNTPYTSFPNMTPIVSNSANQTRVGTRDGNGGGSGGSSSSSTTSIPPLDDGPPDPPDPNNDPDNDPEDGDSFKELCYDCGASDHTRSRCPNRTTRPTTPGLPARGYQHRALPQRTQGIIVDGRKLQLRTVPVALDNYVRKRVWNKLTRSQLSADERIAFDQKASGYVLDKKNKLRVQSQLTADEDILKNIHNLQYQIKALKNHVTEYDMLDVFTIVVPEDVIAGPSLKSERFNLFDDYPKLTPELVGNSNAYYSRWISDEYIVENLNLTYTLFKNNTDDTLFNKCLETYETFHPMQQGGPLILCLILQRVHNASEQHMEHLKDKVETLKITSIEGENVDTAVSLINAAYSIFESSSTPGNSRIPPEWSKTLIKVFKTTSVEEFNQTFKDEEKDARRDADKNGGQPVWPTHEQLTRLATTTYGRLKRSGHWDVPKNKTKGYNVQRQPPKPLNPDYKCWNCGKGHRLNECPEPRNQARIEAERTKFRANRGNKGSRPSGGRPPRRPQFKKVDGKPMILNKNGVYVLDQKKIRTEQKKARVDAAMKALSEKPKPTENPPPSSTPAPTPAPAQANVVRQYDAYTIQSMLQEIL